MPDQIEKQKVLVIGGHLTPAIAVIEEIRKKHPSWQIFFVGRKMFLEGSFQESEELRTIGSLKIKFLPLVTGRLQRRFTRYTLFSLFKVPIGFLQAFWYCFIIRPTITVSFGGYLALPVVIAAWLWRIPILLHEQTHDLGLTNRITGFFARRICLSFSAKNSHQNSKLVVTGLPIRRVIFNPPERFPEGPIPDIPLIYITGGSSGAASLNKLIYPLIPKLTQEFCLIHQVGGIDFKQAESVCANLSAQAKTRYFPNTYFEAPSHAWLLNHAAIVIGRSGANTVAEIAALGKVAIFIPLPWSAAGEQKNNALWLKQQGSLIVLQLSLLTPSILLDQIIDLNSKLKLYQRKAGLVSKNFSRDGAQRIVFQIESLCRQNLE